MKRHRHAKPGVLIPFFILFCAVLLCGQMNQMNAMYRFKKIAMPLELQIKDSVLPKGEYDLEFLRVPNSKSYYLRIMKKGKILHLIQGEEFPYDNSEKIPKKPNLHMSKDRSDKKLLIVFESGWGTRIYPKIRARYCCDYIDE